MNENDLNKKTGTNIESGNNTNIGGDNIGRDKITSNTTINQFVSDYRVVIIVGIVGIVALAVLAIVTSQSAQPQATPSNVGVVSLSVEGDTKPSENVNYFRCPNEVQVKGSITAEGKGAVTYAFVHYLSPAGSEELSPRETIYFDGPQKTIAVRGKFPLSFSEGRHYYEVYLQVLHPVDQRSEPVYRTVECADVPPDPTDFGFELPPTDAMSPPP